MSIVWILLNIALAGVVLNVLFSKSKIVQKYVSLLVFAGLTYFSFIMYSQVGEHFDFPLQIAGQSIGFTITWLNYYFGIMITGISLLTVIFSLKYMEGKDGSTNYYTVLTLKTFGMLGVIFSSDLITFFVFWEIMSWSTFALMSTGGKEAPKSAFKYFVFAITASMILMAGVVLSYSLFGSFDFTVIHGKIGTLSLSMTGFLLSIFIVSFSVESAVFPVHSWLPDGYSNTFTTFTAYLSGISTRIGIYGIILFLFGIFGMQTIDKLSIIGKINFRYIFGVFAALTMVVPTFTALYQHDAKKLIAWHSVGQGGYMLIGLASGSALGIAGGMFHVLNHMAYVVLIVFAIASVEHRTGTTNLNKLGGLIKKMPVSYLALLFGIIGLAGLPPMNGFVSKWFIYRALILGGYPFLAIAAVIGTLGTILSVYKLIHNMFLGQLPERYNNVKEVGFSMQLPMWILMIVVLGLGIFPGVAMGLIAKIQISLGLAAVPYSLHGIQAASGQLNMMVVGVLFMGGLLVAWIIYLLGSRRKHISQYNNYAAGNFLDKNVAYNFNYEFYAAMEHVIDPYRKKIIQRTEQGIAGLTDAVSEYVRRIYTGMINTYGIYVITAFIVTIIILKELI